MRTVYKYPIIATDYFQLELPQDAQILTIQTQHSEPQLWALVDTDALMETRRFRLAGTGHPISDENLRYIGTFQLNGGTLVFHLFEI